MKKELTAEGIRTTPITYIPGFIPNPKDAFRALWDELSWEMREGTPRREFYSNDFPEPYTYGKGAGRRTYYPQPWHPVMLQIRTQLEALTHAKFDVCFLNGYENQQQQLGWHSDSSPEMDDLRPIAIVSLGAVREIWFRPLQGEKVARCHVCGANLGEPHSTICSVSPGIFTAEHAAGVPLGRPVEKLKLGDGSLCLMHPGMQDTHEHWIPKAGFDCGPRISLTFRGYVEVPAPLA